MLFYRFMGVLAVQVDDLRGSPMSVGNLEEIIDEKSVIRRPLFSMFRTYLQS